MRSISEEKLKSSTAIKSTQLNSPTFVDTLPARLWFCHGNKPPDVVVSTQQCQESRGHPFEAIRSFLSLVLSGTSTGPRLGPPHEGTCWSMLIDCATVHPLLHLGSAPFSLIISMHCILLSYPFSSITSWSLSNGQSTLSHDPCPIVPASVPSSAAIPPSVDIVSDVLDGSWECRQ